MSAEDPFADLRDRPVWVCWNSEKGRKVPKSPSGGNARSNDPGTWGTYEKAADAAAKNGYSGTGIMLTDGLVGIDLDGCVHDGQIEPWAQEIIDRIGSYAELSPSGTGIHILAYADPGRTGPIGRADHRRGIEAYNHGRYFTVTGARANSEGIADRTGQVQSFVSVTFSGQSADESFANQVGRLARDQVARRANQTTIHNVARDSKKGVRFARIPMGAHTCTFCMMLASRGFVYHTRETAGEFSHYHSNCRCKVVAGFPGTSVEGYDPDRLYRAWKQMDSLDGRTDLSMEQKDALKQLVANGAYETEVKEASAKWTDEASECISNLEIAGSARYEAEIRKLLPGSRVCEIAIKDIRHTLRTCSGKTHENLYVYDITADKRIGLVEDSTARLAVYMPSRLSEDVVKSVKSGHEVVILHNHPKSSMPSAADFESLANAGANRGIIACHDGSIIVYRVLDDRFKGISSKQRDFLDYMLADGYNRRARLGKTEEEIFEAIGRSQNVEIERIRVGS